MKHIIRLENSDLVRMKAGEVLQLKEGLLLDIEPSTIGRPRGIPNGHGKVTAKVVKALPPPGPLPWPCAFCSSSFESANERSEHMLNEHPESYKRKLKPRKASRNAKPIPMPKPDGDGFMTCPICHKYKAQKGAALRGHMGAHVKHKT